MANSLLVRLPGLHGGQMGLLTGPLGILFLESLRLSGHKALQKPREAQ